MVRFYLFSRHYSYTLEMDLLSTALYVPYHSFTSDICLKADSNSVSEAKPFTSHAVPDFCIPFLLQCLQVPIAQNKIMLFYRHTCTYNLKKLFKPKQMRLKRIAIETPSRFNYSKQ